MVKIGEIGRWSDDRGRRTERQMSEDRRARARDGGQRSIRRLRRKKKSMSHAKALRGKEDERTEDRGQRSEVGGRGSEVRRRRAEVTPVK